MSECANCGNPCAGDFCDDTCFAAWWEYQTDLAAFDHDLSFEDLGVA